MKWLNWVMLALYTFLFVYSLGAWIDVGGDAWPLATTCWFCALLLRIEITLDGGGYR